MSNPLERAFKILDIVASANREVALIEIVQASELPQSSAFRLAASLVETGMLSFNPRNKTYRAGGRVRRLALFTVGQEKLSEVVRPSLEAISQKVEETAFFASKTAEGIRLFDYLVPEIGAQAFIHPGFTFPTHATAAGKVIAAFSSEEELAALESGPYEQYQTKTITERNELLKYLKQVKKQGVSTNDSELDTGVFSACAPVYFAGQIAGALGFVGPSERLAVAKSREMPNLLKSLLEEARHLSALIKKI